MSILSDMVNRSHTSIKSIPLPTLTPPGTPDMLKWAMGQIGLSSEIVAEKGHLPTRGQLEVPSFGQTIRANQVGLVAGNVLKDL